MSLPRTLISTLTPTFPPSGTGAFVAASDIDFYLDVDPVTGAEMIIVSDTVHTRHHAEYLARHITKFEEIIRWAPSALPLGYSACPQGPSAASWMLCMLLGCSVCTGRAWPCA